MKLLVLLTTIITLLSCSKVDKYSSIGSDVIGSIDSSAIKYDGQYVTDTIKSTNADWKYLQDSLSGLHVYKDYLAHGNTGARQHNLIVGNFYSEKSFAYATFYASVGVDTIDTIINDTVEDGYKYDTTDTNNSISRTIDSLLRLDDVDSVTTSLTLYLDSAKNIEEYYNLELSTLPYLADSTRVDTTKRQVLNTIVVKGHSSQYSIELPYHYYQSKEGDTVWIQNVDGSKFYNYNLDVITNREFWRNDSILDDSTFSDTIKELDLSDTTNFNSSYTLPFHFFWNVDSTIEGDTIQNTNKITYTYSYIDSSDSTIEKQIYQYVSPIDSSDTLITSFDTLVYPDTVIHKLDTVVWVDSFEVNGDSVRVDSSITITDSIFYRDTMTVIQNDTAKIDTVIFKYPRGYTDTLARDLDTMNILIKNLSTDNNNLLYMRNIISTYSQIVLSIVSHKKDSTSDTIIVLPSRTSMTVFDDGSDSSDISGGNEKYTNLKLNSANMWNSIIQNKYLSIVQAIAKINIDTALTKLPKHREDSYTLRYFLSDTLFTENGALLGDSGSVSKSLDISDTTTVINLDVTSYMIDMLYNRKDPNKVPPNYLYLWIDGTEMGNITFLKTSPYKLTYIIQNKNK